MGGWKPWKTKSEAESQSGVGSFTTPVGGDNEGFSWFGQGGSGAVNKHDIVGKSLDALNPSTKAAAARKKKEAEDRARLEALTTKTGEINKGLDTADADYLGNFNKTSGTYIDEAGKLVNTYTGEINQLKDKATSQANDNTQTYTNTILPAFKDLLEKTKGNADSAMSLEDYSDPNNALMTAIRDMYNKKGQKARQQGQQDYGVLAALGAQAAQGQIGAAGGNPMTAGMQGQIYAANQRQAGDAYTNAQQRMYDLENQGLKKSWEQNDNVYNAGQDALGAYSNSAQNLSEAEKQYYATQGDFRDEIGGYAGDVLGVGSALNADKMNLGMTGAGIQKGNAYASGGREQSVANQTYGGQQGLADSELAGELAGRKGEANFLSQLAQFFASKGGNKVMGG